MSLKKISLYFIVFLFCREAFSVPSKKTEQGLKSSPVYSFRPLLIQGKKQFTKKTKDIKWESGHIAESQLFFVDIDFKERIFEGESLK